MLIAFVVLYLLLTIALGIVGMDGRSLASRAAEHAHATR
jgi:hypothetical protein